MQTQKFDLVILGSGSTAFAAAIRATELGKAVAMTENRTLEAGPASIVDVCRPRI
jgi:pyruvate/2-oxoglutarate dehydrogenase complex dihydrolipoamide dehydrogenase (E3) component